MDATIAALAAAPAEPPVYQQLMRTLASAALAIVPDLHSPLAALLAGAAIGWQLCGMQTVIAAHLDASASTIVMVSAIALLLAAVGMGVPERALFWLRKLVPHRVRQLGISRELDANGQVWLLSLGREREPALTWLSVALTSAVAGLVGIGWLIASRPAGMVYEWLLDRFFWNSLSLAALEWAGIGLLLAIPWMLNGLIFVTLAATADARGEGRLNPTAGVWAGGLLGMGAAIFFHAWAAPYGLSAERTVMLGTLPLFALAVLAARFSQQADSRQVEPGTAHVIPPELPLAAETLLRGSSAIWGIGASAACAGWMGCLAIDPAGQGWVQTGPGLLLLGITAGFLIACGQRNVQAGSTSASGLAVWLSGFGVGVAAMLAVATHDSALSVWIQALLISVPLGHALHHVSQSWLARSASRALGFAQVGVTLLTGTAIGLTLSRWWALPNLGPMGTLSAGSLILLAAGGLLELYEENRPIRAQRLRLALVFASLAVAIVFYPANTRWWTRRERQALAAPMMEARPSPVMLEMLAQVRTACTIGIEPSALPAELPPRLTRADVMNMGAWWPRAAHPPAGDCVHLVAMPATRALRLNRTRYQLICQLVHPLAGSSRVDCSVEWLGRLSERLANGGTLMLEVPIAKITRADLITLAATFQQATGAESAWAMVPQPEWRLVFKTADTRTLQTPGWHGMQSLLGDEQGSAIHSIRRSRIGDGPAEPSAAVVEWLHARANSTSSR